MKNISRINLDLDKLDVNINLLWQTRSRQQKRAFKKYLFEMHELRVYIQDSTYEHKIQQIYSLFVFVDIYCLQTEFNIKELQKLPAYVYLIVRALKKLSALNRILKVSITSVKKSKLKKNLVPSVSLLQHQISIDNIGLRKIEQIKEVDRLLDLCDDVMFTLLERLNEEYVN